LKLVIGNIDPKKKFTVIVFCGIVFLWFTVVKISNNSFKICSDYFDLKKNLEIAKVHLKREQRINSNSNLPKLDQSLQKVPLHLFLRDVEDVCLVNDIKVGSIEKPVLKSIGGLNVSTFEVILKGDFKSFIKVINQLEVKGNSVFIISIELYRIKEALNCKIIFQNIYE